jgi:hypothetical protein
MLGVMPALPRLAISIIAAIAAGPAAANSLDCGGNAFTYAEVVQAGPRAAAKGPLVSVPESLCADIVEDRKPAIGSLSVQIGDGYPPRPRPPRPSPR